MILLLFLWGLIWIYAIVFILLKKDKNKLFSFNVSESVALKGILALGVVLGHLQIFCLKPYNYPIINQFAVFAQVGVFFFISGYGLTAAWQTKGRSYLNGFVRHRITKIILPLMLATILYKIEQYFLLGESGGVKSDTPLPFSWFCYVIIIYYFVFYFSLRITNNIFATIVILFLLTLACYLIMGKCLHLGDWWYRSNWGFNLGMLVRYFEGIIKTCIQRFVIPIIFLVPFALFCVYAAGHFGVDMEVQATGFSLLSLLFIYLIGFKTNKYFNWLGKYSYEIYLVHPMFISCFPLWSIDGDVGIFVYVVFLFSATLLTSNVLKVASNIVFGLLRQV